MKYIKLRMHPQKVVKSPTKVRQPDNSKDKAKRSMPSTTNCYGVRAASRVQSKILTHSSAYAIGQVSLVDVGGCSYGVCVPFILILFQLVCHRPICGARTVYSGCAKRHCRG